MTTMTSVYQQFLADLSARVKAGTTTAEDIAWLTEATVKLGGSAAAEQEMLAAVNKALSTGEANLTAATTAAETATTAFNAQTTNLNLIPQLKTELTKVPAAVGEIMRSKYVIELWPDNAIISKGGGSVARDDWRYCPHNRLCIDDIDNSTFTAFYDYGYYTSQSNRKYSFARLVRIAAGGAKTVYSEKAYAGSHNCGIALIPSSDNSTRIAKLSTSLSTSGTGTLQLMEDMHLTTVAVTQAYDYPVFYLNQSRELLCVTGGKLATIRHDSTSVDDDTVFADRNAFERWAKGLHQQVHFVTYSTSSSYHDDYSPTARCAYPIHSIYSRSLGFESVTYSGSGPIISSTLSEQNSSGDVKYTFSVVATEATLTIDAPTHGVHRQLQLHINHAANSFRHANNAYMPALMGHSIQHQTLLYRHSADGTYVISPGSSSHSGWLCEAIGYGY